MFKIPNQWKKKVHPNVLHGIQPILDSGHVYHVGKALENIF